LAACRQGRGQCSWRGSDSRGGGRRNRGRSRRWRSGAGRLAAAAAAGAEAPVSTLISTAPSLTLEPSWTSTSLIDASDRRWDIHGRLVGFQGGYRIIYLDAVTDLDEEVDHRHVGKVADIRHFDFDDTTAGGCRCGGRRCNRCRGGAGAAA
jgi:hypothetical protein